VNGEYYQYIVTHQTETGEEMTKDLGRTGKAMMKDLEGRTGETMTKYLEGKTGEAMEKIKMTWDV
jgi:hypothetical protein